MNALTTAKKTAYASWALAVAAAVLLWALCALMPAVAHAKISGSTTGSITVEGVKDGDTVNVYRVVEVTYHDGSNNLTYALADDYGMTFDEYTKLESNSSTMRELADTIAAQTIGKATVTGTATASGERATVSGLPLGQYLISVKPNQTGTGKVYQNTIVSLVPDVENKEYVLHDATVTVKSSPVTVTKTVADGAKTTDAYGMGDEVPFTITATVPSYDAKATAKTFNIIDVPTNGISLNEGSVVVTAGEETLAAGTHYTAAKAEDGSLKVEFVYDQIANYAAQNVTVSLTGTVTEAAVVYTPDTNAARVEFMNNPYDASTVDHDDDEVTVVTYGIYLKKVSADDESLGLEGAVFNVYKPADDGTETIYIDGNGTQATVTQVGTITTGSDGYGKIDRLGAGTYYLIESTAPDGYDVDGLTHVVTVSEADVDKEGNFAGYSNAGVIKDPVTEVPPAEVPTGPGDKKKKKTPNKTVDEDTPRSSFAPQTSDIIMGGVVAVLVIAAGAGVVALRKRKKENQQ